MRKWVFIVLALGLLLYGVNGWADKGVYFERNPLPSATTYYVLVDHSDSTNFKHSDTTSTGTMYVSDLQVTGYQMTARLGYITSVSGANSTVAWFDAFDIGSSTATIPALYSRTPMQLNSTLTSFAAPTEAVSAVASSAVLQIYDSALFTSPTVGDLILQVVPATDSNSSLRLMIQYYTLP